MNFSLKMAAVFLGILILVFCVLIAFELRPTRRVQAAFDGFIRNVENRKWDQAAFYIAPDYHDRWGFDRAAVLSSIPEVCRHFIYIKITDEAPEILVQGDLATLKARIRIQGNGTAIASEVMDRINGLPSPFIFTFRKHSWKPWDWELEKIEQPELVIPTDSF